MTLVIAEARSESELANCIDLRTQVFVGEQGVPPEEEVDGRDGDAFHLLATLDGRPVGTMRLRFLDDVAKMERVCVLPEARGHAIGQALMHRAHDVARSRGASSATLGAQLTALRFYGRLGYRAEGPEFLDAGIPHRKMTLPL